MKPIDARGLPQKTRIDTGVCIIGGGVAGMSIAQDFIDARQDVCLVESGGFSVDGDTQSLYDFQSVGYPVRPNFMARARYFGGTSNLWAGRSMRLDPIDLSPREWVPNSGWPIAYAELERFYPRAERLLELPDPARLQDRIARAVGASSADSLLFRDGDLRSKVVTWGPRPLRFRKTCGKRLSNSGNVRIVLNANVTELITNESGSLVERVTAATLTGRQLDIAARTYVLACGGLENARLLMVSTRRHPHGLGNAHDIVGRYYMDHARAIHGKVRLSVPLASSLLLGAPLPDGKLQIAIGLSDEAQRRDRTLNSHLTLEPQMSELAQQAYQHSANVVKVLARRGHAGRRLDLLRGNLPKIGELIYVLTPKEVMPHWMYRCYAGLQGLSHRLRKVYDLTVINFCEQVPRPDSRAYLGRSRDRLGMSSLVLDWKISAEETAALMHLQQQFAERLTRLGIGTLSGVEPGASPSYTDASHHMGTTRMNDDPRRGVVDRDCRVHDVANLYIAGSSVFPTSGSASPTLTIVALAMRLADHIKRTS
jgi:choline dehydrogenase-like flavoprotein